MRVNAVAIIAFVAVISGSAIGQSISYIKRALPSVKAANPPVIDGDISDSVWASAAKAETFVDRQNGDPSIEQTTAWILYDDKAIYIAFECKDSQPEKITARETVRDQKYSNPQEGDGETEDNVEVVLDSFRSNRYEDFSYFSVNAIGTPSARLGGGRAMKAEWKGDWDAKAKRTANGWTAELRIPWKILNFPRSKQPVSMAVNFHRFQDRTKIKSNWSNIGSQYFFENNGIWTGVQTPTGAFDRELSLLPYVLPGASQTEGRFRAGLDARYAFTPELTAVGSANPDFATIEGAVDSIQFSRSERFLPERRPFFLEGDRYFRAGKFYAVGHYFFSRRIETFDTGTKIYGKLSPVDTVGILNALDFGNRVDTVANYRRDLSPTSSASLFLSQKSMPGEHTNLAVLLHEARWGKFGMESELAGTLGTNAGGSAKQLAISYGDKHNYWFLQYLYVSPIFNNPNGLTFFTDYKGFTVFTSWNAEWRNGFWRGFGVEFFPSYLWHTDGRPFRRGGGISVHMDTRSDWQFGVDVNHTKFDDELDRTVGFRIRRGVSNRFRQWGLAYVTGRQANKPYSFFGPEGSVRLFGKLDIAYGGALQNFEGRQRQHIVTMSYEVSPTRSFGGRLVTQDSATNWYLSFRNAGLLGTETYFILGDPNAATFQRQALMKMVFAL